MSKFQLDVSRSGLSLQNALFLLKAADLVYEDLNQIEKKLKEDFGFLKYKAFDMQDTQAFLAVNSEIIVLAFRGTTSKQDWLIDLNVKFIPSGVGSIHSGFKKALDYIWGDLRKTLVDFRDNKQSIWITGHSLGGALATLAADRLTEDAIEVQGVYTFGQPRVGDRIFAQNFDKKMKRRNFRFVHDEDVVPKTPPTSLGYCDIGAECYFDRDRKMYTENIWWKKFISRSTSVAIRSSEKASELRGQNPGGIGDHGLGYYERCIRENLIKQKGGPISFEEYINS